MKEPRHAANRSNAALSRITARKYGAPFVDALNEYKMIEEGDNIAVCISGGKVSMLLAKCMQEILRHGKMKFELHFLVMDPGYHPAKPEADRGKCSPDGDSRSRYSIPTSSTWW